MTTDDLTRQQRTAATTAVVVAWLWHSRGARAIAREVGYCDPDEIEWMRGNRFHVGTPWESRYRADVVGLAPLPDREFRFDLVEVKSTRADMLRDIDSRKWRWAPPYTHQWIAGPEEVFVGLAGPAALWGHLVVDPVSATVRVKRRPSGVITPMAADQEPFRMAAWAIARCQTTPVMKIDSRAGAVAERIARSASSIRERL